ncbi:MAG: adenylyl-sulfate kinase [Flammeovirgaceae bacterium TMED32]|nr:MAG: adenylyl-sulfate kinase [Flammeovirgaceae bacterium TMED32]|tara:strand:+ start:2408 stop:3004 length:597 start_codon:yes stop_codon:yes gene_type:complete
MNENLIRHTHPIGKSDRLKNNGHQAKVIWLVGLSGSGKSTLAGNIEAILHQKGYKTYLLDGDNIRLGLNNDLGFSSKDRTENIRRIAEVARLFNEAGIIVLSAFISPLAADRAQAQRLIGSENFIEIFIDCPLRVCEKRDVKGLYDKARKGLIPNFTGIDAPFENPKEPDLTVNTETDPPELSLKKLLDFIEPKLKLE